MKLKELTILVKLKKEIKYQDVPEVLSKVINSCFLGNKKFEEFHKSNKYKNYCYSGIFPVDRVGIFFAHEIYSFKFRTLNFEVAEVVANGLISKANDFFVVLNVDQAIKTQLGSIESLYTVTPTVIVENNKNWIPEPKNINSDDNKQFIKGRIIKNTTNKFKNFMGLNISEYDFVEDIRILNNIPIVFNYKGGKILSNKLQVYIKQDNFSQELAFMLLATGILEKNSLSFGFCTVGKSRQNVRVD